MVKMCGKFMTKAYLFAIILLFVPFTGCLETEESEPSLKEAFDGLVNTVNTNDNKKYCSYILDYYGDFLTGTEKKIVKLCGEGLACGSPMLVIIVLRNRTTWHHQVQDMSIS